MQISAKNIMLEQYSKLLKNDTSSSSSLATVLTSSTPTLASALNGSTESSSSSMLDSVEISQAALKMLQNYSSENASTDEARKSALEKIYSIASESLSESGQKNLKAIIEALEKNIQKNDTSSLLETLADVNKESNAGKGHISYNTNISKLLG